MTMNKPFGKSSSHFFWEDQSASWVNQISHVDGGCDKYLHLQVCTPHRSAIALSPHANSVFGEEKCDFGLAVFGLHTGCLKRNARSGLFEIQLSGKLPAVASRGEVCTCKSPRYALRGILKRIEL